MRVCRQAGEGIAQHIGAEEQHPQHLAQRQQAGVDEADCRDGHRAR